MTKKESEMNKRNRAFWGDLTKKFQIEEIASIFTKK